MAMAPLLADANHNTSHSPQVALSSAVTGEHQHPVAPDLERVTTTNQFGMLRLPRFQLNPAASVTCRFNPQDLNISLAPGTIRAFGIRSQYSQRTPAVKYAGMRTEGCISLT